MFVLAIPPKIDKTSVTLGNMIATRPVQNWKSTVIMTLCFVVISCLPVIRYITIPLKGK